MSPWPLRDDPGAGCSPSWLRPVRPTRTLRGTLDDELHVMAAAPIFFWELSLGIWLVVKGFGPSPVTAGTSPR